MALFLLMAVAAGCALPAPSGDAPLRYRDFVFSSVSVTSDLSYGSAPDLQGNPVDLRLDLYQPTGDTALRRPAIVWIHGGGFTGGGKLNANIVEYARRYARLGYVAVSIDYRLLAGEGCGGNPEPTPECRNAALAAQHDAQAAVRWLRSRAATHRIDPSRIAVAGSSAGAVTALLVGTNRADVGNSGNPGFDSAVGGVASLSGGLPTNETIDAGDAPTIFFHGSLDTTVPQSWADSNAAALRAAGDFVTFHAFPDTGHGLGAHRTFITQQSSYFFYYMLDLAGADGSPQSAVSAARGASGSAAGTRRWSGTDARRLGTIAAARSSRLRWRVSRRTATLVVNGRAVPLGRQALRGAVTVPGGVYRDVRVRGAGRWSLQLAPAAGR